MVNKQSLIKDIHAKTSRSLLNRIVRYVKYYPKQSEIKQLIKTGQAKRTTTRLITGDHFDIVLPDNISRNTYLTGFFEAEDTEAFIKLINEGDTFVDIGAHLGYYSMLAARLSGPQGKVVSFEPTPSTFEVLQTNLNRFENSSGYNVALFSTAGELAFNDYGIQYMSLNSYTKARVNGLELEPNEIKVPTIVFDEFVAKHNIEPNIIKIDAESAELEILKGSVETIRKYRPKYFIEVGDFAEIDAQSSLKIIKFLESEGYGCYEYGADGFVPHQKRQDPYPSLNLYFFSRAAGLILSIISNGQPTN